MLNMVKCAMVKVNPKICLIIGRPGGFGETAPPPSLRRAGTHPPLSTDLQAAIYTGIYLFIYLVSIVPVPRIYFYICFYTS